MRMREQGLRMRMRDLNLERMGWDHSKLPRQGKSPWNELKQKQGLAWSKLCGLWSWIHHILNSMVSSFTRLDRNRTRFFFEGSEIKLDAKTLWVELFNGPHSKPSSISISVLPGALYYGEGGGRYWGVGVTGSTAIAEGILWAGL